MLNENYEIPENSNSSEKLETALKTLLLSAKVYSLVRECFPLIFVEQVNCLFSLVRILHFRGYLKILRIRGKRYI